MASTYSNLKIELMGTGDQSGTWGVTTNTNLGTAIEEAITGSADVSFLSADVTLTLTNTNTAQTARNLRLNLTGTSGGARSLTVPAIEKQYIVKNNCADTITVKCAGGVDTGVGVPAGTSMIVYNNGTNVVDGVTHATSLSLGSALPVASGGTGLTTYTTGDIIYASASGTLSKLVDVATGNALISGGIGVAPLYGKIGLTTHVSGTLPVANGGTGVTTSTGSGNVVLSTSPTLVTPILGTPSSGTLTSCTGLPLTTGVTGTLPVANGGTGVTTSTGSGNNVLSTSPTLVTPILGTPTSGTLTSCTGLPLTTGVTGTLPVANGGTGVTTSTGTGSTVLSASPTLTGTPLAPTAAPGTSTTQIATTAFVQNVAGALGTMATQNANAVAITGGTIDNVTTIGSTTSAVNALGYLGIPQNPEAAGYTLALDDAGKHIYYTGGAATLVVPTNASVAFPIGSAITIINNGSGSLTISTTSITMNFAGTISTGNRTLATKGMATIIKVTTDGWFISGVGLT